MSPRRALPWVVLLVGIAAIWGTYSYLSDRNDQSTATMPPSSRTDTTLRLHPNAEKTDKGAGGCGVERAAVKHLTDGWQLPARAETLTPEQLVNMAAPLVTQRSPRLPEERRLVRLRNVRLVAAKQEADSDLHIIIATATGAELNIEAPQGRCDAASPYAARLAAARAAIDRALPPISSQGYTPLAVTATVEGVLFFDVLHGQRGAPNGVELHPVTSFTARP